VASSFGKQLVNGLVNACAGWLRTRNGATAPIQAPEADLDTVHSYPGPARTPRTRAGAPKTAPASSPPPADEAEIAAHYPGDFHGTPAIVYAPVAGAKPDPGEVVWAWTPFEEDHTQGKVRPVLLLGRDGTYFIAAPFTSVDHDLDERQEASEDRYWVKIGTGSWDPKGRVSYARVNRIIRVDPHGIEGRAEQLDKKRFDAVVAGIAQHYR